MTGQKKSKHTNFVSELLKSILEDVIDAMSKEHFWGLLDEQIDAIVEKNKSEATLRTYAGDPDNVAVFFYDGPTAYIMPLVIYDVDLPAKAEFHEQVEETRSEIAALNDFAKKIKDKADEAERKLLEILDGRDAPA